MRIILNRFAVVALVLALIAGFSVNRSVKAQDAMGHGVACDADLILSLYTAEYHFDFAAVHDKMMADHPDMQMADLAGYDEGQFAPLFAAMMTMMDTSMSMGMMDETTMTNIMNAMAMDQAAMDKAMMEMSPAAGDAAMMTELAPASVADEPAECTALRDELRHFYIALAYSSMMPSGS